MTRALLSQLPGNIALRELVVLREALGGLEIDGRPEVVAESRGPGNALVVSIPTATLTEVFTAFGEKGRAAEAVAHHLETQPVQRPGRKSRKLGRIEPRLCPGNLSQIQRLA